jgi:acetyl esterase/lipase
VDPILTKDYVMDAARAYATAEGDLADPRFSPLFGTFNGFPSALIMAGKNEILLDDSIRLRDRIIENGQSAQLDIEENGWHVYQQMPIAIAERAMKRLSAYVSEEIYGK